MEKNETIKSLKNETEKLRKKSLEVDELLRKEKISNLNNQIKDLTYKISNLRSELAKGKAMLNKPDGTTNRVTKKRKTPQTEDEKISFLVSKNKRLSRNILKKVLRVAQERLDNYKRQRTALKKRVEILKRQEKSSKKE